MVTLYGIPNCDTVRKARKWLDAHGVDARFHDIRKDGLDADTLARWSQAVGWETLLNRRGQGWRKLPEATRNGIDEANALRLMLADPVLIKRPVLDIDGDIQVGFKETDYASRFA